MPFVVVVVAAMAKIVWHCQIFVLSCVDNLKQMICPLGLTSKTSDLSTLLQRGQQDASPLLPVHGGGPHRVQHVLLRVPAVPSTEGQGLMPAGHGRSHSHTTGFLWTCFHASTRASPTLSVREQRSWGKDFVLDFVVEGVDCEEVQVETCCRASHRAEEFGVLHRT